MPRLVVQEHSRAGEKHYDLMLENPGMLTGLLWTWRFDEFPGSRLAQTCERIPDHEPRFLEYEGPLSADKGSVRIVDSGTFDLLAGQEDQVVFTARARRVIGSCRLLRGDNDNWSFTCEPYK